MYRHKRKPITGEAVQFVEDGANDSIIASWFGVHPNRVREVNVLSAHTLNGNARRVERGDSTKKPRRGGDWLIRTKSGGLYVCPEADFAEHYMKMEEYPKRKKAPDAE